MLPILISLVVLLMTNFPHAQSTVCSYSCSQRYTTRCGFLWLSRCTRYRASTCYRCCTGWSGSTSTGCNTPICIPSCSNGGNCTGPDYCSSCNRGYYSPRCSRCTSIANCVDVYCSSSSNQRCDSCEGDYGPTRGSAYRTSRDNRRCIKQCSWRTNSNACYPGHCTDGQCTCNSGFSGQDCRTMGSSQAPVISEHRAFLIKDNLSLESPASQGSTSTVYTDVIDFTRIRVVWKVRYRPTGLPDRPPYISSVSLGLISARTSVSVRTARGSVFNIGTPASCSSASYSSPLTNLVECEFQADINYRTWNPSTGDVITYNLEASSGGRMRLYNRDSSSSIITRYYNGPSVSASSSFTFALSGATHCTRGSHCRTTMLNVGEDIVSEPVITVTWDGWYDSHAGINEYNLEVRQLSGTMGDEMTEIPDTPAVYQGVSVSGLIITLPHAGVYSFVLSVVDNLDNARRSRRFVFFDDNPDDVTIRTDSPMRVQVFPYVWKTHGAWLNDRYTGGGTTLLLDWQGHFANEMHHSQGLLKPIGLYANGIIDADYDQNFGERGRAAVTNALGVRKFRVFSDVDHSGGRTIANASDGNSDHWRHVWPNTQAFIYNQLLVDGDSIRLWVEARDIAGHFVRDSMLVHVDSSPPVIEDTKIAISELAMSVHFRAFDEHSGIKAIDWWLFDNETDSVVESGHEMVAPLNVTENITNCGPPACLCTPLGDCYATAQAFKPTLPAGFEEHDFFIEFSVTNNAGLASNDTIKPTMTAENVGIFAEALEKDSSNTSSIDDNTVVSVADLLDSIVNIQDTSPELTESVVNIVSNLLQVGDNQLGDTDAVARSSSRMVRSLGRQISNVLDAGGNVSYETSGLAVRAMAFYPRDLAEGLGFAAVGGEKSTDNITSNQIDVFGPDREVPIDQVAASVELPAQIAGRFSGDSIPVSFIMYQSSRLFRSKLKNTTHEAGVSKFIDSRVVSATVNGAPIKDLPVDSPVVTAFLQEKMMGNENPDLQTMECVFWNFSLRDGIGEWSTEGCRRRPSVGGRTVCHCNHTTNFAVLVSIYEPISSFALDVFSKIGCSVSVVALIITIFVYSVIRSLRALEASRILISFCFSLLLLYLVFLAGVENTSNRAVCITAAVLMHYFALTSMAWMSVEAANLYLKLVKVFNSDVQHFMIKASIVAWGLPMVVVIIILAVDYTEYDNQDSCFLKAGPAFYLGEFLLIGLVFLFNLIVFVFIVIKLTCSASKIKSASDKSKRAMIARRLKSMASVTVLLGLTWAFGLLSVIKEASLVFQVLFCVFNSLQGLLIFLLFVVRQEKVREGVSNLVRRRREGFPERSTSSNMITSTSQTKEPSVGFRNEGAKQGEADETSIYENMETNQQPHKMVAFKGEANYSYQGEAPHYYDHIDTANDKPGSVLSKNTPTASGKTKKPPAVLPKKKLNTSRHYQNSDIANHESRVKFRNDATKHGEVVHSYENM